MKDRSSGPATPQTSWKEDFALVEALWRGKWRIAAITALALLLGAAYGLIVAVPKYTSTAVVVLETRQEQVVNFDSVIGGLAPNSSVVNTEVEVLRSRGLMRRVVDDLNLTDDPEFNEALRPDSLLERVIAEARQLVREATDGDAAEAAPVEADVVDALLARTSVRNIPSSFVFSISATSQDPRKSARIADSIARNYILDQLDVKFGAMEQASAWLTERVAELQVQLEDAETAVKDFRAETDVIDIESLALLNRQLKEVRDRLGAAEAAEAAANDRLGRLLAATGRPAQAEAAQDRQLDALLTEIEAGTPRERNFDDRFAQILDRVRSAARVARDQAAPLRASRDALEAQVSEQSDDLIALQQLMREAEANRLLYEYFLNRLKETSAQEGIQQADSRILSQAVVNLAPSSPRMPLLLGTAALLGLVLGAAFVLLREAQAQGYRSARELEEGTGHTVMGQIPRLPMRRRSDILDHIRNKPTSAFAEAFRNLRTSLLMAAPRTESGLVVLVSSAIPMEGKSTISTGLAQSFSTLGKRVLLVEGDIRRHMLRQILPTRSDGGLLAVLEGTKPLGAAVERNDALGADVLYSEQTPRSAADVLSGDGFAALLGTMRRSYDVVVIDSPPVLVVPDARIIARHADLVLLTVRWDHTSAGQVAEAIGTFDTYGTPVAGTVLSNIDLRRQRRYGYDGYARAYDKAYFSG